MSISDDDAASLSSAEVNLLIQHYLQELGYDHAAFAFACESRIPAHPIASRHVPPGALVNLVQKGVLFSHIESAANSAAQSPASFARNLAEVSSSVRQQRESVRESVGVSSTIRRPAGSTCFLDEHSSLLLLAHRHGVTCVKWSPNGDRLATGSMDGTVVVWSVNLAKGTISDRPLRIETRTSPGDVLCVAWSKDSALLAIGSFGSTVSVYRGPVEMHRFEHLGGSIVSIDFHTQPDTLAFGDSIGRVSVIRGGTIACNWTLNGVVSDVLWTGDDVLVAAVGPQVFVLQENQASTRAILTAKSAIVQISVDHSKRFLAVGEDSGVVTLLDMTQNVVIFTQLLHPEGVCGVVTGPEPLTFLCAGSAGTKIVRIGSGDVTVVGQTDRRVYLVTSHPGGQYIATAGSEGSVQVWDMSNMQLVVSYNVEASPANCLEWAPSGRLLAVGLDNGTVAVADFSEGSGKKG